MDKGFAPAKVNLALHVTGRAGNGYHLLDSLVVFAGVGDTVSATAARGITFAVAGAFAPGVPVDDDNLVMQAALLLASRRGVRIGAQIRLTKILPHAAGIGGASSDAAAAIRRLAELWRVAPLAADDADVLALGSDVPVCMRAPVPQRLGGTGDDVTPWGDLPPMALVLVNPRVELQTAATFAALERRENSPLEPPPAPGFDAFTRWLARQRNDLEPPARALVPQVGAVLARLRAQPGVVLARMSGSGATCFGLCRDLATAKQVAKAVQISEQGWWVAPAPVLG
ncbi:MAG: 4-(cytidine 5'-diphospho)-2-C-methyl-D-erythritol kinase [Rubellimicrobium sp.]|nr:4-(cytidine 5'-diphospho)-2-C-methyl-D-erythritol kinase [Rubellimicrobium sp.]